MYIVIQETEYREIRDLTFKPEIDLTGGALPIGEFAVSIVTVDDIEYGAYARLYDDVDQLWAEYVVMYAERMERGTVKVVARSRITYLDYLKLPAVMYTGATVARVLDDALNVMYGDFYVNIGGYALDQSFDGVLLTGYCPEQTARDRVAWVCYTIGAYVKDFFNTQLEILPAGDAARLIPMDQTFMAPSVTHRDNVTALRVKVYAFERYVPEVDPETGKETTPELAENQRMLTVSSEEKYISTETEMVSWNPDETSRVVPNVVDLKDMYFVNADNVGAVVSRMGEHHFNRTEVSVDVIDNGTYLPGQQVTVYIGDGRIMTGLIQSCDFHFGVQARAALKLAFVASVDSAKLEVRYLYEGVLIGRVTTALPVGYAYAIKALYIDRTDAGRRRVYRPTVDSVTGTMGAADTTVDVPCEVALEQYQGILSIFSVDALYSEDAGVVSMA